MEAASGNYSPHPWMQDIPVQVKRPNASFEDTMTGEALASQMSMSADEIRDIRPPLPINPFPPRFGYRVDALGIRDIVRVGDLFFVPDFSGKQSGYQGTSYPSLNQF